MEDPRERLVANVSTGELERRWKLAREVMKEHKVDFLLTRQDEEFYGGFVRWFTGITPRHSYPFTVIFPIDDGITTIGSSPTQSPGPPEWAARGIQRRLGAPYYPSLHYTAGYDAELAAGVFAERKNPKIGIVGKLFLHLPMYEYLTRHVPGATFFDLTDPIDYLRAVKSPEEIEWTKGTASIQVQAMEHLKRTIQPGMKDLDIQAEADYVLTKLGTTRLQVLISSFHPGETPVGLAGRHYMNRTIREGDQIIVLLEGNGPGGYYTEISRVFYIGKEPSQETQDMYAVVLEAQKLTLSLLKPGAHPKDIWDAHNEFLRKHGSGIEGRMYAHGEGYDMVERPAIRYDEPMAIQAGMNLAVHPNGKSETVYISTCENYIVTENGASESIHRMPQDIIVL